MPNVLRFLADLPTTNLRSVVGIGLSIVFVVGVLAMDAYGNPPSEGVLWPIGTFILLQMGLDVTQFAVKRMTFGPRAETQTTAVAASVSTPATATSPAVVTAVAATQTTRSAPSAAAPSAVTPSTYDRRRGERRGIPPAILTSPSVPAAALGVPSRLMGVVLDMQTSDPVQRRGAEGDVVYVHDLSSIPSLVDDGTDLTDHSLPVGTINRSAVA